MKLVFPSPLVGRLLVSMCLGIALVCHGQTSAPTTAAVNIDSQKELSGTLYEVAGQLEKMYGYSISYEAPKQVFPGDLEDQTLEVRRDLANFPRGNAPRVLAVRRNDLSLKVKSARIVESDYVEQVVTEALELHNGSAAGVHFRLAKDADGFHIVPSEVRDSNGMWVAATSFLDTRISLTKQSRTALEAVAAIGKAIAATTGVQGGLMTGPLNLLASVNGTWEAKDEPARNVLRRVLNDVPLKEGNSLGWVVGYIPAPETFGLNITYVQALSAPAAAGAVPQTARGSGGAVAISSQ